VLAVVVVERVQAVLEASSAGTVLLVDDLGDSILGDDDDLSLLTRKLDAGGFSAVSINSADDLRNKAEYMGLRWQAQHGRRGFERYSHLRSIVWADVATAYEATKDQDDPFGIEMLKALRELFTARLEGENDTYGVTREHLEGLAYRLTAQCQVAWSRSRPWEAA